MTTSNAIQNRPGTLQVPQLDYILLDGSSSMRDKWFPTLAAIDSYVDILTHSNMNAQIILTTFCSVDISCEQRNQELRHWKPLHLEPVGSHWGGTPLYDAINTAVRTIRDLNPSSCHLIIATDGENTSSVTSIEQAKAILDWCRAKGWQITFIGCDFNNSSQAALLGTSRQSAIGVAKEHLSEVARALGHKRVNHARTGSPIHFSEGEQTQFGGYLTGGHNV